MYRKRLASMEMANNPSQEQFVFLRRVTGYPMVNRVWIYTNDAYGKVKSYNGLVKFTFDVAESVALEAAGKAKPVIAKLEIPITIVDSFACMTLDKLEETAPLVKSTPEEIASETKKLYNTTVVEPTLNRYNDIKAYGLEKVTAVTEYGVQKARVLADNKYGQMLTLTLDQLLLKADTLVDAYVPAPKVDGQPEEPRMTDDGNPIDKVVVLSKKFRQRLVYHGLVQIQAAKKRTEEILANLKITLDLIQQRKSEYLESTNKAVKERLDQAHLKVLKLWEELNKDAAAVADDVSASSKTFEQKLLFVARQLTAQLNSTYQKLSSTLALLPAHIQPNVQIVHDYIGDLYIQLSKTTSWDDVSTVVIGQWRDAVKTLQEHFARYFDQVLNSRFVAWMVKSVDERKVTENGLRNEQRQERHANGPDKVATDGPAVPSDGGRQTSSSSSPAANKQEQEIQCDMRTTTTTTEKSNSESSATSSGGSDNADDNADDKDKDKGKGRDQHSSTKKKRNPNHQPNHDLSE